MTEESLMSLGNSRANKVNPQDRPIHDWYRFVLSFPPHLVQKYLEEFNVNSRQVVLDPFCGTGTTLIESKFKGIQSYGIEANAFAHFASSVKLDWEINPEELYDESREIAENVLKRLKDEGIEDDIPFEGDFENQIFRQLNVEENKLILTNSISPLPLHKTLTLLELIRANKSRRISQHELLALSNALVSTISNLRFGPEVGVGKIKKDVPVVKAWLVEIDKIIKDLKEIRGKPYAQAEVFFADARTVNTLLPPNSVDAVITSPPYPNEKDYTRITRLESVILGFTSNRDELRKLKRGLVRSNTRNVYKGDDDDNWIVENQEIQRIAEDIEKRRIELNKTSGFERLYSKVTKLYFGGMAKHLANLRPVLRTNANLAYVVGDQASYLRVMIHTGTLLGDIAKALGYELLHIDLFRTRLSTATKSQLREEVVILKWRG